MSYKPGDTYYGEFTTSNPNTSAAVNADSTPTATANHNGADDGTFALVVTNIDTGRYKVTGTIPVGYAKGDTVVISVAATVSSVAGKDVIDRFVLDSKRVGDLNDYAGGDTAGTTTLLSRLTPTRAGNLDNLDAAVSTRSTYSGVDTVGTTTLLGRITSTRAGNLDNLDAAVSTRSTYAGGAVASVTAPVTVGTNNDKTGYTLSAFGFSVTVGGYSAGQDPETRLAGSSTYLSAIAGSVWNTLTSALTTAGSIGKAIVAYLAALGPDNRPILSSSDPSNALAVSGTVNDTGPTTAAFKGSAGFSTQDGFYLGRLVIFTASSSDPSALNAEATVTGYIGLTRQFTFGPTATFPAASLLPIAPANGDAFTVV